MHWRRDFDIGKGARDSPTLTPTTLEPDPGPKFESLKASLFSAGGFLPGQTGAALTLAKDRRLGFP